MDKLILPKIHQSDHRSIHFEKLRKRILRSKVKSVLEVDLKKHCNRYKQYTKNVNVIKIQLKSIQLQEEKIKSMQKEQELERQKSEDFPKKRLNFSLTQNSSKVEILDPHHRVMKKQAKALNSLLYALSDEDKLEIGEDPAYYILNEQLQNHEFLCDQSIWNNKTKPTIKEIPPINSDSRLLHPKNDATIQLSSVDSSMIIENKSKEQKLKNAIRRAEFLSNYSLLKEYQQRNQNKMIVRYNQKISQANQRIQEIREQIEQNKDQQRQEELEQVRMIKRNQEKLIEDQYLQDLNTQMRRICIEKQVKKNKEASQKKTKK